MFDRNLHFFRLEVLEHAGDDNDAAAVHHTPCVCSASFFDRYDRAEYTRSDSAKRGGIVGKPNVYKVPANFWKV